MTLRTFFEKEVFIRLTEDRIAFVCTTKWRFFSKIRRVGVDQAGHDAAHAGEVCMPNRRNAV